MTAAVLSQPASQHDRNAVVTAAASGDGAAFRYLYDQHAGSVYNFVLRSVRDTQLAEDVCQEVWTNAYRELSNLREPGAFSGWLYRIAGRACVDMARKRSRGPATVELHDQWPASAGANPEHVALRSEQDRLAWESLGALPERQHLALFLREVEGRSYQEIAEIMKTSKPAVETLLFRARRAFADAFERLEMANEDRCGQARTAMSVVIDGEATPVQLRAVSAHTDACPSCRNELQWLQRGSAAYAGLPLLPVSALLGERVFEALGLAVVSGSVGGSVGAGGLTKLSGFLAAKTKVVTTLTLAGTLTVAALATPLDHPSPTGAVGGGGPAAHYGPVDGATSHGLSGSQAIAGNAPGSSGGERAQPNSLTSSQAFESSGKSDWLDETLDEVGQLTEALPSIGPTLEGLTGGAEQLVGPIESLADGVVEDASESGGQVTDDVSLAVEHVTQSELPLDTSSSLLP